LIVEPFDLWWCCLNPRERNSIVLLIGAWFTNNEYITQFGFTLIAFTTGLASLTLVSEYFIQHYGLTAGIIIDEEGEPVNVYFFDEELWAAFYAFSLTDEFICSEPCKLLTFPN